MRNQESSDQYKEPEQFEATLKAILQTTAGKLGQDFVHSLVEALCQSLSLSTAIVARWADKSQNAIQTVTNYSEQQHKQNFQFKLKGSFCESVLNRHSYHIKNNALEQFPQDLVLLEFKANGCFGVTLKDSNDQPIGFLLALCHQPLIDPPLLKSVFQIFSFRVAAELERQSIIQNLRNEVIINQTQLDSVPALMFMLDRSGRFLRWNQYFKSQFGFSHRQMLEEPIWMAIHESDRKRIELELEQIFTQGHGTLYVNCVTKKGEVIPMLATAEATTYKNEPVIVGVALDMTEQQSVEHNLLRSQGRLARKNSQLGLMNRLLGKLHASHSMETIASEVVKVLRSIQPNCIIEFSLATENRIEIIASTGISQALKEKIRIVRDGDESMSELIRESSNQLQLIPEMGATNNLDDGFKTLLMTKNIRSGLLIPLVYHEEVLGYIGIWYKYETRFQQDELEFYQTIGSSISLAVSNARQFNRMQELATRDNLTGLPNRNALNQDSQSELVRIKHSNYFAGLILIDLDRFKEINDTLDHQIGDKLLQQIGPRLSTTLENHSCSIYRLGGDEFGVLVTNKLNYDEFNLVAQTISDAIAHPFEVDGLNLEISSSIGIATTHGVRHSASEILRCAELAMYHAKSAGGGIAAYTPELDADTNQRFVIMAEMAEAIRNNDLVIHYQPKFDIHLGKITGCEALVRWQHKRYGLLPPTKFIPLIEYTQLIHPLTYWVMRNAMAQLSAWKQLGIEVSMAINLSTQNLTNDDFLSQVDSLVSEFNVDTTKLEFEVTETALMRNLERAKQQLTEFSHRGIHCSLDDYGTGYSSLSYIKKLPLDILKIDRSFISRMLENEEDRIIAQSTIKLAHSLGLKVVAEGVENEITLEALSLQDCDFIQGFHISEPLDAESFATLFWEHGL